MKERKRKRKKKKEKENEEDEKRSPAEKDDSSYVFEAKAANAVLRELAEDRQNEPSLELFYIPPVKK